MNCQCAERVTILSLCVCIGIAESWVLHCLSRVSYRWGKKKEEKEKNTAKRKWWRLKHGFVCLCGKRVKYMCVSEREAGKKKAATVTYFWVISFQKGRDASVKYSEKSKMIPAQLMQKVGHLGCALRGDLLTHQSCQSSLSGVFVGFPSTSVWACFRPRPGVLLGGIKKKVDFHKVITS